MTAELSPQDRERWIHRNQYYYDDILRLAEFVVPAGASVLEAGCGTGQLIGRLRRTKKAGVDLAATHLDFARERYSETRFFVADLENPRSLKAALGEERFDFILLSDTLSYVKDVQSVLEALAGHLAPQGRLLITHYNKLWEPAMRLGQLLRLRSPVRATNWLDKTDFKNLFRLTDWEIVSSERRLIFPKPLPLISDLLNRFIGRLWPLRALGWYDFFILRRRDGALPANPKVSVIVPARNEAGTIKRVIDEMPRMGGEVEVIFVEGHSKDNTWETIKQVPAEPTPWMRVVALQQEGVGKADAMHKGFAHATGDLLMILDADLSVEPQELARFYAAAAAHRGDFINGSRLVYPLEQDAMPYLNILGNKFFSQLFSFLLGQDFKDTLCGTKVLWRKDYERLAAQRDYFGDFDPFGDFELLFGAAKLNLKIIHLPVHYKARVYGQTNISRFRHALLLFRMCLVAARRLKFA